MDKGRNRSELIGKVTYIIDNNPRGVTKLLHKHGYPSPQNPQDLYARTKEFLNELRVEALDELMTVHPDRELILENAERHGHVKILHAGAPMVHTQFLNFTGEDQPSNETLANKKPVIPSDVNIVQKPVAGVSPHVHNFLIFAVLIMAIYLIIQHKNG